MSMNGVLIRLDDDDLAWLRQPLRDGRFADHPDAYELEQAFAGVHFLLTGSASPGDGPLAFLASDAAGEAVTYSAGHGPGRVFEAQAVTAIAAAIESLPARLVRERLASEALATVYPFSAALTDEDKEWLLAVLQGLMTYVRRAADDGVALLMAVV